MNGKYLLICAPLLALPKDSESKAIKEAKPKTRPNVVIVIGDDCSYTDLHCYGSRVSITPNIDRLAQEGLKFNHCYQSASMSSPTRHTLYTGLYPVKSGAYPNHTFVYDHVKTFVQYFGESGYRTALYGKEHVAPRSIFTYEYLGNYKSSEGMNLSGIDAFVKECKASSTPFFLVVGSHEPHYGWTCGDRSQWNPNEVELPPFFVDTPETRRAFVNYLAEVNVLDSQVGCVNELVKDNDIEQDTILVFLSEQGNSFTHAKWTCYNQGLHSAMIIKYPRMVKAGSETDALVEYVDILPTIMDVTGVKYDRGSVDGKSFGKVLKRESEEHKRYSFGIQTSRGIIRGPEYYGIRSVCDKRYRYIVNLTPEATMKNMVLGNLWWRSWVEKAKTDEFAERQVNSYLSRPAEELYDMQTDPWEQNNLAEYAAYRKIKQRLKKRLRKWMSEQGDQGQTTEMAALERMQNDVR